MSKIFSRWLSISEVEADRDPCRLIDLVVIDSVVSEDDHGTTTLTSLRLDPCVDLTRLLSKGKIQAHLASHLYEVPGLTDTVTLEHLCISDHEDEFTLSMSHPFTESLIGGTVVAYESGKVMFFPVFQSTSKRLVDTRVYLAHEFTKTPPPHSDTYSTCLTNMAQYPVTETNYAFTVIDGYPQLSDDDLEEAFVWWFRHSVPDKTGRMRVDCPKGYRPHTLVVEYWEGPSVLTGDNEVIAKVAVGLIPANEVSLHVIPRDDWNLTQGAVTSFYVDIPLAFEPTNQGTYRYSMGDRTVSVRYSASPDGGVRVRMFLPTGMDLPDDIILAWSKDPTLGITHQPLIESTKETTMSKEPVIDATKANKETKMILQRTEYKLEQPISKDGLLWASFLRVSPDQPGGIVEIAGQCRVIDSSGSVKQQYRELANQPVSAEVVRLCDRSGLTHHILELTTPKGWIPSNVWLHVIAPTQDPRLSRMELYCDFRIEDGSCDTNQLQEVTKVSQSPENTVTESPDDPTLFDTLFHSCKFVTEAVSTEHSIELELPYGYHTNRIAIISTQNPKDQSYVHSRAQLSPSLIKRNEYLLRLVTAPGVVISDVRHRLDQEDNILIQVDIHRPQDTEVLPVNPEPLAPSDNSPKPGQTDGTVVHQSPTTPTPKQLVKEIYENGERIVNEILQSTNNYFTWLVREELATNPDLKCILESPVPENLVDRLYYTLTDAGYVVEIDKEKLDFTIKLPPLE